MKKLLCSAAVCGLALAANPAQAQDGLTLEFGGWFKGYAAYVDQDENVGEVNSFDIIRHTEVHFGGETTLDNGLTVGVHFETEADGGEEGTFEESYAYFSGSWGRVNFGAEDGAAYLLQVEAPSADDNIDGLRQYVQPVNYAVAGATALTDEGLDYDQDQTGTFDKITYLSPIMNGFQLGASFTPDSDGFADDFEGVGTDDDVDDFGRSYEAAVRYEGQFNNIGVITGAGYSHSENEEDGGTNGDDDRDAWNVGLDLDIGPFGLGAIYSEDDRSNDDEEEEIIVVGVDYTTGPFKLGASYYNSDNTLGITDAETDRYSGGVTYTFGPGMTLRGSIAFVDHEDLAADDIDATSAVIGTQINF